MDHCQFHIPSPIKKDGTFLHKVVLGRQSQKKRKSEQPLEVPKFLPLSPPHIPHASFSSIPTPKRHNISFCHATSVTLTLLFAMGPYATLTDACPFGHKALPAVSNHFLLFPITTQDRLLQTTLPIIQLLILVDVTDRAGVRTPLRKSGQGKGLRAPGSL